MIKNIITLILLLLSISALTAQNKTDSKNLIEDFVPKGWEVILYKNGDLNKDGIKDAVVVIEKKDPKNIRSHDGFGSDTLNLNPRNLLVLFKRKEGGYTLVSKNEKDFIPSPNSEINPCLSDPLLQDGDITIDKGILTVSLRFWLSCGSWYVNNASYVFRYQQNQMMLIGFDHFEYHRANGESSSTSINLSTGKQSHTTGKNMFDDSGKPKTVWSKTNLKPIRLEDMNDETYFKLLKIRGYE